MRQELHEECGVFGIYSKSTGSDVAAQTYLALYALQHRGQESCGIAVCDEGLIQYHRDLGLVPDVFSREVLEKLGHGNMAVGHVRAFTSETRKSRSSAQPLVARHIKGAMAISHNGNITNARALREKLEMGGAIFTSGNNAEILVHVITKARLTAPSIETAVEQAMNELEGAYSLVIMSPSKLIAVRDPQGFRPLCMGSLDGGVVFASETCALDSIGAAFVRDILPGEIVIVDKNGVRSITTHCGKPGGLCVFEFIYLARPDSVVEGVSVHTARQRAGAFLAQEHPVDADVVIGVPDSGLDAALGYAKQSGIPYGVGFIKNRYIGRTFIQPTQAERDRSVRIKLNTIEATLKGKRVVLIDDSIVRGTTTGRIVKLVREAGAAEVHVRISSPPFVHPCYFGTDIDSRDNLIACRMTEDEIRAHIGADSLGFLSVESVPKIVQSMDRGICSGCFTGAYPVPEPERQKAHRFERKIGAYDIDE